MVERSPGVWRLRVYVGRDDQDRPIQVSRTFKGGRRASQAELARTSTAQISADLPAGPQHWGGGREQTDGEARRGDGTRLRVKP